MKRIQFARQELGDMDVTGKGARLFDEGPRRVGGFAKKKGSSTAMAKGDGKVSPPLLMISSLWEIFVSVSNRESWKIGSWSRAALASP